LALIALAAMTLGALVWTARASTVAILPPPRPLEGAQPYATLLCKFDDVAAQPLTPAYFDRLMLDGPESLDQYWRRVSYGKIHLTGSRAFGWFEMAGPRRAYRGDAPDSANLEALARDCAAAAEPAVDFRHFAGINLVFNQCIHRPRGGEMALTLDGERRRYRVTWLCPGASSAHQIVAHEMGHSFGLTHSEDWNGDEYGNTWDVMSVAAYCAPDSDFGYLAQEPIAVNKDLLGWIPAGRKFDAPGGEARTIVLKSPEGQGDGYLIAEIPLGPGRMYTVEARVRAGFDHGLPASGILIHEVDLRRPNKAQLVSPARGAVGDVAGVFGGWGVGTVFRDSANGVAVTVDRSLHDGFIVTIRQGALPDAVLAAAPHVGRAPDASGLPPRRLGHICADESRN
jgi:M6 family metalloprotease-like protein